MFLRLTGGESSIGAGGYRCLLLLMIRLCRSFMTMSAMSLGRVLACQPSLSSAAENTKKCSYVHLIHMHTYITCHSDCKTAVYFWISFILKWGQRVQIWKTIFTWNAFALNGFGYDGSGLVAWLAQSLTKLLYAVSVDNDSMPAIDTHMKRLSVCLTHIYVKYRK